MQEVGPFAFLVVLGCDFLCIRALCVSMYEMQEEVLGCFPVAETEKLLRCFTYRLTVAPLKRRVRAPIMRNRARAKHRNRSRNGRTTGQTSVLNRSYCEKIAFQFPIML